MSELKEIAKKRATLRQSLKSKSDPPGTLLIRKASLALLYKKTGRVGMHGNRSHFWYSDHFYKQVVNHFDHKVFDQTDLARWLNNYGVLLRSMRRHEQAEQTLQQSVDILCDYGSGDPLFERMNLAIVWLRMGKLDEALEVFEDYTRRRRDKEDRVFGFSRISEYCMAKGHWDNARKYALKAMDACKDNGTVEDRTRLICQRVYSRVMIEFGNHEEAMKYALKSVRKGEELYSQSYWTGCLYQNLGHVMNGAGDSRAEVVRKHGDWVVSRCLSV
jgi:tetratricopeptide (TPR) repeat protein